MKTATQTDNQRQLAHFRGGVDAEMIALTEGEYRSLKAKLAKLRKTRKAA